MTKYEKAIYEIVCQSRDHLTAEEVFAALRTMYPKVSQATVYNNLKKLNEEGLIRKVVVEGSPDRYDRIAKHDHHVCRRCGKLADASFEDLTATLRMQLGEEPLFYDLKVYYICPECRAKEKEALNHTAIHEGANV